MDIVQKVYEWPGCSFNKWFSHRGIILAKGQLDNSYTFWTMSILIFSPVQIITRHRLFLSLKPNNYCFSTFSLLKRLLQINGWGKITSCSNSALVLKLSKVSNVTNKVNFFFSILWPSHNFIHFMIDLTKNSHSKNPSLHNEKKNIEIYTEGNGKIFFVLHSLVCGWVSII